MKILKFDRSAELKAEVEGIEDLWLLSRIVDAGDQLEADSMRRTKSEDKLRPDSGEKVHVKLVLEVESVEFAESANRLRVSGKILSGTPERFVQKGSFHTVDLEPKSRFILRKGFLAYHLKLLDEASKRSKKVNALVVVLDERSAVLASLQRTKIKFLFELENRATKRNLKEFDEEKKGFYGELLRAVEGKAAEKVIVAGPGFAREEFQKYAAAKNPELARKFILEHASSAEKTAVVELLKRGVLERILGEGKLQEEFAALEKLKESTARGDGMSCYGPEEVRKVVDANAASMLLISDELLRADKRLNSLLEKAQAGGASILIFNSQDEAGAEFAAFQVAALLRYKMSY